MEPPTYEEIAAVFEELALDNVNFDDRAYEYLMENMDSEPGTPEFDEQFGGFLNMIGATDDQGEDIMEAMMELMMVGLPSRPLILNQELLNSNNKPVISATGSVPE